ncbi:hypothetical protein ABKN59_010907 [Abortiporus biennis]
MFGAQEPSRIHSVEPTSSLQDFIAIRRDLRLYAQMGSCYFLLFYCPRILPEGSRRHFDSSHLEYLSIHFYTTPEYRVPLSRQVEELMYWCHDLLGDIYRPLYSITLQRHFWYSHWGVNVDLHEEHYGYLHLLRTRLWTQLASLIVDFSYTYAS